MEDIAFIEQLVNSMDRSVYLLERAIAINNIDEANRLKTFIFDLNLKIEKSLGA